GGLSVGSSRAAARRRSPMSRVVVVTGAARGIGDAIGLAVLELGDEVVSLDVVEPENLREGGRYVRADVSDPASVEEGFAGLERVDVLVSNAGVQRVGMTGKLTAEDWLRVIGTNLNGAFLRSSAAMQRMPRGGSIMSVSSAAALVGLPGRGP